MNTVLLLAGRNLRLFFRDRAGVFFSMLGPVLLLGLYALFLGRLQADQLAATFPQADDGDITVFVAAWVFAGVTMIATLTTGLSAISVFVEDRASGRFGDFLVSPLSRAQLVLGYLVSCFVIAFALSILIVVIGVVAIMVFGGPFIGGAQLAPLVGDVALSAAAFAALSAFAAAYLRTTGAFAAFSTVVGTVLGFLAGAYIAPGVLPTAVVNVIGALPFAQSAMLLRQPFVDLPLDRLTDGDATATDAINSFYGMTLTVGDFEITNAVALGELALVLVLFTVLAAWRMGRAIR